MFLLWKWIDVATVADDFLESSITSAMSQNFRKIIILEARAEIVAAI